MSGQPVIPDAAEATMPGAGTFDLSTIKSIDSWNNVEFVTRFPLLIAGGIAVALWSGDWTPFWLAVLCCLTSVVHIGVVRVMPSRVLGGLFFLVMATAAIGSLTFVLLGVYLWMQPVSEFHLLSLILLAGSMLTTVSLRVGDIHVMRVEIAAVILGILLRIYWLFVGGESVGEAAMLSICLFLMTLYYFVSVQHAFRGRLLITQIDQAIVEDAKLTAVGRLTGGIAHDFNNMLTAVLGNIELAQMARERAEQDKLLSEAQASALRGACLTRELLALSGRSRMVVDRHNVEEIIDAGLAIAHDERNIADHVIEKSIQPDLPKIPADLGLLSRAVAKLVENAIDAMPDGGTILVSAVRSNDLGEPTVTLSIRDTGSGISPELRPYLFEPYFTTKPVGKGSGLGLPMAKGVVEQLNGRIDLQSTPGLGTEVFVHLPVGA